MDAMDNCSLKYEATEPKEVGTTYSEIIYQGTDSKISFGGIVLNYNQEVDGEQQLTAKIYYTLDCNNMGGCVGPDKMVINTIPIQVSESNNLKARVAYQSVVKQIKDIYDFTETTEEFTGINYIKEMWKRMQYQYDQSGFNMLLSATALKTMGDYLQECQACFKWGGYINKLDAFPEDVIKQRQFKMIKDKLIYRSVSVGGAIVPYNEETGDGLRLGIQGDRPSGFRSIYMLLNGEGDVNDQAITGYMFTSSTQNPSRTLLVSRNSANMRDPNINGLKGSVIYATRELQVPDKEALLKSLEFLTVKDKARKVYGEIVSPTIGETTIIGSTDVADKLLINPMSKIHSLKNSAYEDLLDYTYDFEPLQPTVEVENDKTDAEEAREQRQHKFTLTKGMEPDKKKLEKERIKAEKLAAQQAEKEAKAAEKLRIKEQQLQLNAIVREAKQKINNLRTDLTPKQKTAKTVQIPISFLNNPEKQAEIQALQIPEDIYKIIYDESVENDRISRLAEEKIRLVKQENERKKQEKLAEAARIAAEQEAYYKSEEGIAARIAAEQEERDRIARQTEEEAIRKTATLGNEERKTQIQTEINELESEQTLLNKKKGISQEEKERKKYIFEKLAQLRDELRKLKRSGGGTLSNKRQHKHKITKRIHKNVNQLTKKNKKQKVPKRTRKLIK
ncbi:hypothetical protein EBU24_05630 [bacterium]|nr:hypothetical protein [bacterium]